MVTLVIEVPDAMLKFIDGQVAAGRARSRSEYIQQLIMADMFADDEAEPDFYIDGGTIVFADAEQRERVEKMLERRIEAQRKNPKPGQSWDEVKREIRHGKT